MATRNWLNSWYKSPLTALATCLTPKLYSLLTSWGCRKEKIFLVSSLLEADPKDINHAIEYAIPYFLLGDGLTHPGFHLPEHKP